MLITKQETPELNTRQYHFLTLVRPEYPLSSTWDAERVRSYSYDYIPGEETDRIRSVIAYLKKRVWCRSALTSDHQYSIQDYIAYVKSIVPTGSHIEWLTGLRELPLHGAPILVHGDCTLENWIDNNQNGEVVPIDPGMPRGFNHRENDIGKLLQSCLTFWKTVKSGNKSDSLTLDHLCSVYEVTWFSLASCLSHWYRVLKNKDRHPSQVGDYAEEQVIPFFTAVLGDSVSTQYTAIDLQRMRGYLTPK